jgi:hypothetical protein
MLAGSGNALAKLPKWRRPPDANAMQTHMRTHRWRMRFAPVFGCNGICDWACNGACQSRVQSPERGEGLLIPVDSTRYSPPPYPASVPADVTGRTGSGRPPQLEVWHHLTAALAALSPNDYGRPWPGPRRDAIARALTQHEPDLCIRAARETRQIVTSQDRAPNITALFEKKLRDLVAVRETVRDSLGEVAA